MQERQCFLAMFHGINSKDCPLTFLTIHKGNSQHSQAETLLTGWI